MEDAAKFERMAAETADATFKENLLNQAAAYRQLSDERKALKPIDIVFMRGPDNYTEVIGATGTATITKQGRAVAEGRTLFPQGRVYPVFPPTPKRR